MAFTSKNINSILCVFTLLTVPVNNILAMELECSGKIDKKETNTIEDIEFTAKYTADVRSGSDAVIVSVNLPIDGGEGSITFTQDMNWLYSFNDSKTVIKHITAGRRNYYIFTLYNNDSTFVYEEYNKDFGYTTYALGEGDCVTISNCNVDVS